MSSVSLVINASGGVSSVLLARTSGFVALDKLALEIVNQAAPFPPLPSELSKKTMLFEIPINFKVR